MPYIINRHITHQFLNVMRPTTYIISREHLAYIHQPLPQVEQDQHIQRPPQRFINIPSRKYIEYRENVEEHFFNFSFCLRTSKGTCFVSPPLISIPQQPSPTVWFKFICYIVFQVSFYIFVSPVIRSFYIPSPRASFDNNLRP